MNINNFFWKGYLFKDQNITLDKTQKYVKNLFKKLKSRKYLYNTED